MPSKTPDLEITPEAIASAQAWAPVLEVPAGKERFRAIRDRLRSWLKDAGVPSAGKNFLSEKAIMAAGRTGSTDKLPNKLKKMLGSDGQQQFSEELQTAYYLMAGKAPRELRTVFDNMMTAMEADGVPKAEVDKLRAFGPARLAQLAPPAVAASVLGGLSTGENSPLKRMFSWAAKKVPGKTAAKTMPLALSEVSQGVQQFVPNQESRAAAARLFEYAGSKAQGKALKAAGVAEEAAGAAGKAGLLKRGVTKLTTGGIGKALAGVGVVFDMAELYKATIGQENKRREAEQMAITGEIPAEFGPPAQVPLASGEVISAKQFLRMMDERERAMKVSRFNAQMQEQDLTREVMSAITDTPQPGDSKVQRVKLGSARPQQQAPMPTDQAMKQFYQFLRQATG